MQNAIMLAYDIGTSGIKTSMIDAEGNVVDVQTSPYPTHYAVGGIAEQDPRDWWNAVCTNTRQMMERNARCKNQIVSIGVSGHMLGCIPVDRNLEPLHPCMIHSDSRAFAQYARIDREIGSDVLYRMSGNVLDARSSLCKMLWFRESHPELYNKTSKFLQSKDYIVAKLTGNADTTDYSDACHGELMNISSKSYDSTLYQQLGLSMDKLPMLHKGTEVVGRVTEENAKLLGLPSGVAVIAGGGDGACANVGAATTQNGQAHLSIGSTAWIAQVAEKPILDQQKRVFNIITLDGEACSVFGAIQSAGSSVNWALNALNIKDVQSLNEYAAQISPGCEGLLYVPYLDGERSPIFDANASGLFMGLSQRHNQRHFARAILEGPAYALRQIADILRENAKLERVHAIGGGMKSALWAQIIASICGLELQKLSVPAADATSLGIAAAAGTAIGVFKSISQALSYIHIESTFYPEAQIDAYEKNYQAFLSVYPAMKDTMHMLRFDGNSK